MAGKISDLYVNIGAKTDDFKKGTKEVTKEAESLGYSFKGAGVAIAGAFAAGTVIAFGKECVQLANIAEGVETAFKRIGNEAMLDGLRKATKGTVNDLELMKAAVQAQNFGIPLQQLGSLLEFAHQRAKDTGQSVEFLVQSIIMGIGRKSPLILDNLGISAVALKEKMKGVASETASVGDVARAVGEIAKDSMSKIGESALTAKEQTEQLNASWANFKVSVGKSINEALVPFKKMLIDIFDAFKSFNEDPALKDANNFMANFFKQSGYDALDAGGKIKAVNDQIAAQNDNLKYQQEELAALKAKQTQAFIDADGKEFRRLKEKISFQEKYINSNKIFITQLEELKTKVDATSEAVPGLGADPVKTLGLLESAKKKVEDLKKEIEQATTTTFAAKLSNDLVKAESDLLELQKTIRNQAAGGAPIGTGLTPMQGKGTSSVSGTSLDDQLASRMANLGNEYTTSAQQVVSANTEMAISFDSFAVSAAEGLGAALVGVGDFGKSILMAMIDFMSQLGQQMIAVGLAGIALQKLALAPGLALAAGLTLVALAGAARATMASGVGGSGGSRSSSGTNIRGSNNLTVEIAGVVKGSDIYFTQKNYNNRLNATTSRG